MSPLPMAATVVSPSVMRRTPDDLQPAARRVYDAEMRKLSWLLFLFACGDDGARHTPDAAPHRDGAPDSPADAAVNPVTFAAVLDGQPVSGVQVYFQNADSSLVLATTTDATGTASAVMAAGGYVTAVNPATPPGIQQDELDTFVGVKPGDHLIVARSVLSTTTTVTVQAPGDSTMNNYTAYSPCNVSGTQLNPPPQSLIAAPVSAQMSLSNCGSATDFVVQATNGSASEFFYAANQPIVDQGTVDLTTSTYAPSTPRTITYTNVPALRSMSQQADLIGPSGPIFEFLTETPSDTPDPTVTFDVPLFTGAVDVLQTFFNFNQYSQQITVDWGQLGSGATIDMATRALNALTGPPTLDPSTHQASVATDTSTGMTPDFSMFALSATRQSVNRNWVWYVAAPYGASVTLPTVPSTGGFDFNVGSADSYNVDSWVNGKVPGGYDAVRALVLTAQPYLYNNGVKPQDLVLGGSGTASFIESESAVARKPHVLRHRTH